MPSILILVAGAMTPYLLQVQALLAARGCGIRILDARQEGVPLFDARALPDYRSAVLSEWVTAIQGCQALILAAPACHGGAAGALLNLLQLVGGAAYDHPQPEPPFGRRPVGLVVTGSPADTASALEQLEDAMIALGGAVTVQAAPDQDGDSPAPGLFIEWLLGGPFAGQAADRAQPLTPIDMSLGDIRFPPPEAVTRAVAKHAGDVSIYTQPGGLPALRRALAGHMQQRGHHAITDEQVSITSGGTMALYACLAAGLKPGDGVLYPDPGFPNFRQMIEALGLVPIPYALRPELRFLPDMAKLERLAGRARAVIWNDPHNPSGAVSPPAMVRELVALAERHDLLIISDEVYADLVWEGEHLSPAVAGAAHRTCVVGSFSKMLAMAGHRLGWVLAPAHLAHAVRLAQWAVAMSPALLSQHAGLAGLRALPAFLPELRSVLLENRRAAAERLDALEIPHVTPPAAFYLWVDITATGWDDRQFAREFHRQAQVSVTPGSAFGPHGTGWIRLTFASPRDEVIAGVERLGRFYHELRKRNQPAAATKEG